MKIILCNLLLLLWLTAPAQSKRTVHPKFPPHQLAVSINPLALVNTDQRVMAGVEQRFAPRFSWLADAGVVVSSVYIDGTQQTRGFDLRPAIRYYYSKGGDGYVQGQLQYRMVNYRMDTWLGKDCVDGVPAYEQKQEFTFRKQNFGIAIVTGGVERLGKRLMLDVSVGLGLQHRTQEVAGEENCCFIPEPGFIGNQQRNDIWIPVMPIAVKLAYVIR